MPNFINKFKKESTSKMRELIILPIVFFTLSIVFSYYLYFPSSNLSILFLPINDSIFESIKTITTSFICIILFEYFFYMNMPNNYLLSRVMSMIVMVAIIVSVNYILIFGLSFKVLYSKIIANLIAIYIGQYTSFFIQKLEYYRYEYLVSLFMFVSIFSFITYISLNPYDNIMFYALNNYF